MKCRNCGHEGTGMFCDYCGSEMPKPLDNLPDNYYEDSGSDNPREQRRFEPVSEAQPQLSGVSPKSKSIALILCIFFGYFGAHHFYAGKIVMGLLYLFTMGLCGIGWVIDIIIILMGRFKDSRGKVLQ